MSKILAITLQIMIGFAALAFMPLILLYFVGNLVLTGLSDY